jgi:hypothetical protein
MKTLIILFTMMFSLIGGPITMKQIESENKTPDFKYYYDKGDITFGMLGYWNDQSGGVVYMFTNDTLLGNTKFSTYNSFINYVTPKDEASKKYILINPKIDKISTTKN